MKTKAMIWGAIGGVLVAIIVGAALNPLRRSPEKIQESLIAATPLGSRAADVRAMFEKKFGVGAKYYAKTGYMKRGAKPEVVGVSSLEVHLGSYREIPVPLVTDVMAFWGFDEKDKLIDVWVWKTTDGP